LTAVARIPSVRAHNPESENQFSGKIMRDF